VTASRPSRTMPTASLATVAGTPSCCGSEPPKVSPAAVPRGRRRRGRWKGQVAFTQRGPLVNEASGGGSLGSGSARATVLGGGGERHHRN
jgi:hypothetical protein